MKLKVYVIDLEVPPRVKKWGLRIGIPAVVLTVAGVAFAGPLHTWNQGDTLNASDLNGNFTNLQQEVATLQANVTALQGQKALSVFLKVGNNGTVTCDSWCEQISGGSPLQSGSCV